MPAIILRLAKVMNASSMVRASGQRDTDNQHYQYCDSADQTDGRTRAFDRRVWKVWAYAE
jgi:hypothetical protein